MELESAEGLLGQLRLGLSWISSERKEEDRSLWGCSGLTSKMLPWTVGESEGLGVPWNRPRGGGTVLLFRTVAAASGRALPSVNGL